MSLFKHFGRMKCYLHAWNLIKVLTILILQFFNFLIFKSVAQPYPQNYFRYPLDSLPNYISPFGGLRDNHFHSGADLRTNQREGLPVYASADGYISRIKIQSGGYGKAVYIDHPNGYTTVYGHLQRYNGPLAKWIHQYQYQNQRFELDKIFERPVFFVKKGDTIGYSGNSGGSTGPHLHYEIRDTKSEKIINPLLFGMPLQDSLKPTILSVHFYKFVTEGLLLKKRIFLQPKQLLNCDSFFLFIDTIQFDPDLYGIGIEAYDYIHNAKDEKVIYQYQLWLDGKFKFQHQLSKFAFDENKFINAHIDYPYYKLEKTRIQKCFVDDGNEFSSYKSDLLKGRFYLNPNQCGYFDIRVIDYNNNQFNLRLCYKTALKKSNIDRLEYNNNIKGKKAFYPLKENLIKRQDFVLKMDPCAIYDTIFYEFDVSEPLKNAYSNTYRIHHPLTPIHKSADISIKPFYTPKSLQNKLLLAYFDKNENNFRSAGGYYENGFVHGKMTNFGSYFVCIDTIAPTVKQVFLKDEEHPEDTLKWDFEIKDNFSGIDKYEAYLDGKWILLDFDAKNNLLTYRFDELYFDLQKEIDKIKNDSLLELKPDLIIIVTDRKGNKTEKEYSPWLSEKF